ncbi:MAG: leucyl/phenylalanyl-tRNA--protein transferase [Bacteroidetes bacterium]|nr:leucyl/phenylalanyl-tRNA--protein transferase [Bacteroidota bacterium]
MPIYRLTDALIFPPVEHAEDGILAVGGDLSAKRLLLAYRTGVFPWFSENEPIIWWSPDPRFVMFPDELKVSKSMKQLIRNKRFEVSIDTSFEQVIQACAQQKRKGQPGTWITDDMIQAYMDLHEQGYAHSVEVWRDGKLVGGLYGVSLGKVFFGESMFHTESNASKYGFIHLITLLTARNFQLIDCQVETDHLRSLGALNIPRSEFLSLLHTGLEYPDNCGSWKEWS